jgi:hypothetical protein
VRFFCALIGNPSQPKSGKHSETLELNKQGLKSYFFETKCLPDESGWFSLPDFASPSVTPVRQKRRACAALAAVWRLEAGDFAAAPILSARGKGVIA